MVIVRQSSWLARSLIGEVDSGLPMSNGEGLNFRGVLGVGVVLGVGGAGGQLDVQFAQAREGDVVRMGRLAIALCVFLMVASAQDDPLAWFPLRVGTRWVYEHEAKSGDETGRTWTAGGAWKPSPDG